MKVATKIANELDVTDLGQYVAFEDYSKSTYGNPIMVGGALTSFEKMVYDTGEGIKLWLSNGMQVTQYRVPQLTHIYYIIR
jgi:hypothetical protein